MSDLFVKTDIAERIKARRNEIRLKQQELADKVGVSVVTISRWENPNSGRSPNSSKLLKLAEALNTSVEYLLPPEDINKEEKIKDPLLGTEYPPNSLPELGLAYWGSMVDNAQRVAKNGTEQEKAAVLTMLRMAENAITGDNKKGQPPSVSAYNGNNSSYSGNTLEYNSSKS